MNAKPNESILEEDANWNEEGGYYCIGRIWGNSNIKYVISQFLSNMRTRLTFRRSGIVRNVEKGGVSKDS